MAGDAADAELDLSRRDFMLVGTTSLLSIGQGGAMPQLENPENPQNEEAYRGVADLLGPADANGSAVEITTAGTLDTAGQRRWIGFSQTGGSGAFTSSPGLIGETSLDFNLPGQDIVTLAANGVGGSATVWGYVSWEEYF